VRDGEFWRIAREVCTPKQLEVLELRDKHGFGKRLIAMNLGLSTTTVRDRLDAADRKIRRAYAQKEAA